MHHVQVFNHITSNYHKLVEFHQVVLCFNIILIKLFFLHFLNISYIFLMGHLSATAPTLLANISNPPVEKFVHP